MLLSLSRFLGVVKREGQAGREGGWERQRHLPVLVTTMRSLEGEEEQEEEGEEEEYDDLRCVSFEG